MVQGDLYQVQVHEVLKEILAMVGNLVSLDEESVCVVTRKEVVSSGSQFFPNDCCCSASSAGLVVMGLAGTLSGVFKVGLRMFVGVVSVTRGVRDVVVLVEEVCGG